MSKLGANRKSPKKKVNLGNHNVVRKTFPNPFSNMLTNNFLLAFNINPLFKKKSVTWDLEGPISSGYLAQCSRPFFLSIRIEFSAFYSMLSQSRATPTSLAGLFINPEVCQCPLRRSRQLQLF